MEIDHVLVAVDDLIEADRALRRKEGLRSIEGGRHPDWGTANRLVLLGDAYLELVAVVDDARAARTTFGRWVRDAARPCLLGWAARTSELDKVARRLNLAPTEGARTRPDGEVVRWRIAGVEQSSAEPSLPFFIEWAPGTQLPGRAPATRTTGRTRIKVLHLAGDAERLGRWLGPHDLPITISPGTPATTAIVLTAATGDEIVLDATHL